MQKRSWLPFLFASCLLLLAPPQLPPSPIHILHPLTTKNSTHQARSPLPACLSLLSSTTLCLLSASCTYPHPPSPSHRYPHTSLHHHLHQPSPYLMEPPASVPPVVSLDWIQLGRLFALQSLLVGFVDDRLACWHPLPASSFLSLTHTYTHKHILLHPSNPFLLQPTQCRHPLFLPFLTTSLLQCIFFVRTLFALLYEAPVDVFCYYAITFHKIEP